MRNCSACSACRPEGTREKAYDGVCLQACRFVNESLLLALFVNGCNRRGRFFLQPSLYVGAADTVTAQGEAEQEDLPSAPSAHG